MSKKLVKEREEIIQGLQDIEAKKSVLAYKYKIPIKELSVFAKNGKVQTNQRKRR